MSQKESRRAPSAGGALVGFLRRNPWVVFLAHQSFLFATAAGFLYSFRTLTGRDAHLGREPLGAAGAAALVVLSSAVIALTWALYRWVRAEDWRPLGIKPSARRAAEMLAGALFGFALAAWPWLAALALGRASVRDNLGAHFGGLDAARVVAVGVALLLLSALTEEVANRAFPMRLWQNRSLAFRVIVPSLFFAAAHFAGEPFGGERALTLFAAGVTQSLAYALTGDVWLASGLHFGANYAGFSASGLWHAGAVAQVFVARPLAPNWLTAALMLIIVVVAFAFLKRFYDAEQNHPRAARREA